MYLSADREIGYRAGVKSGSPETTRVAALTGIFTLYAAAIFHGGRPPPCLSRLSFINPNHGSMGVRPFFNIQAHFPSADQSREEDTVAKIPTPSMDRLILDFIELCETKGWLKLHQLKTPRTPPTPRTPDYTADQLLKSEDAARVLGVASKTLAQWRMSGNGPRFVKLGRSVVYKHADLMLFAFNQTRSSTSDTGGEK